jgi:tetratricopeptide (TPR) repeat protein
MFNRISAQGRRALSSSALALALGLGVAAGGLAFSTPALAAKKAAPLKLSPAFQKIALDAQKAIETAKGGGDPAAAKALLDQAFAAVVNDDDKFMAGNLAVSLGSAAKDSVLQRRGLESMLASGKVPVEDQGRFNVFVAQLAMQARDYPATRAAILEAKRLNHVDPEMDVILAEAYIGENQTAQGLTVLAQAIETRRAAGQMAPEAWYRRGLGLSYKAKALDQAGVFAKALARDYPTKENWAGAITVVREVGNYKDQEVLDLMRLMDATGSYAEKNDYLEYIQTADARRLPGEVLHVIEAGIASGKVPVTDGFASDAKAVASGRLAADKASLAGLERDARGPAASAATLSGAGDAFLSYNEPAKAIDFFTLALAKPGIDQARVLTRLGIAQVKGGRYAEAQATLAKVTGPRKAIADLWALYAGSKAAPPSATAAVSPAATK